jgi:DNA-binding beta-propeller fold protein YncE
VRGVAFSPDGKRIVTASADQTAKVWDAATGRELLALKGHTSWVRGVAFSPDGKRIVTASADQTAKVWDAATGREVLSLKGHNSFLTSVAFSPDGTRIVTGGGLTAREWDAATGREVLVLKGHTALVRSVAYSPDGTRIVTGSHDRTARVWDIATGREVLALQGHKHWVNAVAFSPDGKRIVTGSEDRTVKVWDAEGGQELLTLQGHTSVVFCAAFSPDGKRLVTGSYDKTAKVWDAERGQAKAADGRVNTTGFADEVWPLPDPVERKRYHTEQAALAVRQKQWFAAEFHLGRVLRDDPRGAAVQPQIAELLKERLPALLQGEGEPGSSAERLAVARLAYRGKHFAVATRLWARALESDPTLGDDRLAQHRYSAACAAALAAAGQGQEKPPPDDDARAKLRGQALDWLTAELKVWARLVAPGPPPDRLSVARTLSHWQKNCDLAGIRDAAALAQLPAAEQKAFARLWADVAALLKKVTPGEVPGGDFR